MFVMAFCAFAFFFLSFLVAVGMESYLVREMREDIAKVQIGGFEIWRG